MFNVISNGQSRRVYLQILLPLAPKMVQKSLFSQRNRTVCKDNHDDLREVVQTKLMFLDLPLWSTLWN